MKSKLRKMGLITDITGFLFSSCTKDDDTIFPKGVLLVKEQGSFTVGGTVIQNPGTYDPDKFNNWQPYPKGQTYHGDHAYVFYQIPYNTK